MSMARVKRKAGRVKPPILDEATRAAAEEGFQRHRRALERLAKL